MDRNQKYNTAEVLARIKARLNGEIEEVKLSGTEYDFSKNDNQIEISTSQINPDGLLSDKSSGDDNRRASLNIDRALGENPQKNTDLTAHLLSKEVDRSILNRCAPMGALASGESGLLSSRHEHNAHASIDTSQPETMGVHSSLTPIGEEESLDSDFDQDDDAAAKDAARGFNANLYEVRFDAYDNKLLPTEKQKKGTQYRIALDVRSTPEKRMNESTKYMLDFYNRPRDLNKRLEQLELNDDPWYETFDGIFDDFRNDKTRQFKIKPLKAFAKRLVRDGNRTVSTPIPYCAGIFYQAVGEEPTVMFIWGTWTVYVTLDEQFNRSKDSNLWKKGRYLDESRSHLDIDRKQKTKLNLITRVEDI